MSDFERCSELRDWRRAHAGDLPRRRSDNEYEQSLARWYSKASQRQHRALSSRPSERQLTPDETAHLDSIVRIAIESPAAAPVEPLRKRLRTLLLRHRRVQVEPSVTESNALQSLRQQQVQSNFLKA